MRDLNKFEGRLLARGNPLRDDFGLSGGDDWSRALLLHGRPSPAFGNGAAPPAALNIGGISVIQQTGADDNRIDIVFLGDGYTSSQIAGAYHDDVNALVSYLFTGGLISEPFNRYRNFFNVYAVNVISNQSGADNPGTNTVADTALNATYYFDGVTERLLYIDNALGNAALSQALTGTTIHADMRFVTVNSDTYGGGGGFFSVYAGGNPNSREVALHELAHSFAGLGDEYVAAGSGGAGGSTYSGPEPAVANVTTSPTGAKWAQWLGYDQPGIGVIGAYEGAQYYTSGLYRPSMDSKMRTLGKPFDAVAREQFVLDFYKLVDPIDSATPGSSLTDPTSLVVNVIDPAIIRLRWSLDGVTLSDGSLQTFQFGSFNVNSGTHSVVALAYDPTDWVRLDRSSLEQQVSWTVTLTHAILRADGVHPLVGGSLTDTVIASAQPDSMSGGAGIDTLSYALSNAGVTVGLFNNSASGGFAAGDTISDFENVLGSVFADSLSGDGGANLLNGGAGADVLGGRGGDDFYYVDNVADQVIETAGQGNDRIVASVSYALGAGVAVEALTTSNAAGTGALNLSGNEIANTLSGNAGVNSLDGKGGADIMAGLGGSDFYYVDNAGDRVLEGASEGASDRVLASVSYVLGAGAYVEVLVTINNAGTAALNLTGNEFAQTIQGNAGANVLDGKAGADTLQGLGGNDLYYVDVKADRVIETAGGGSDRVLAATGYALAAGVEVEMLTTTNAAGTTAINLTGNALAQSIVGNAGANILDSGGGGDVMVGLGGDDFYYVRAAGDRAVEAAGAGNDRVFAAISFTLEAGSAVEVLSTSNSAGTAALNLTGNAFANTVLGNAGANLLDGGAGADTLAGFGGADRFAFTSALGGGNVDRILDFVSGSDKLLLDHAVFGGLAAGGLPANAFVTGPAAADGNDRIIYNNATGQLFYDADGNGGGSAMLFATLDGHPAIGAGDFLVI